MIFRLILTLLLCHGFLGAAPAPRVLAWDYAVAERKLALASAESAIELTRMHPLKRTAPVRLKGAGPFVIRALDKAPDAEGKLPSRPLAIPESIKYPLLVLMPDDSHPTGIRLLVVDDDPAGFGWGTYRFLNATPKDLVVQLENKALKIPTGWKSVDLNLGGERRGIGTRIALAEQIEKPLYSAVWEYDPDLRTLCFLVPGDDPRLSPVVFKAIPEDRLALQLDTPASQSEKPKD